MRIVCTCAASVNPGSTLRSATNVRIISTALTSSTSAIATCATTSRLRARCRSRLALAVRFRSEQRDACPRRRIAQHRDRAEQQPGQHRKQQRECDATARPARSRSAAAGLAGPNRHQQPQARRTPRPRQPRRPSSPASRFPAATRAQSATAPRPAPTRTASSCCRASARTSSRFATLVHAISITTPIVAITTQSTLPTLPTTCSLSGRSAGVIFHVRIPMRIGARAVGPRIHPHGSSRATSAFGLGNRDSRLAAAQCRYSQSRPVSRCAGSNASGTSRSKS